MAVLVLPVVDGPTEFICDVRWQSACDNPQVLEVGPLCQCSQRIGDVSLALHTDSDQVKQPLCLTLGNDVRHSQPG